ncbi:MAG TPA: glycerate kinase [Amycolatopsis sp.]|uniref:glycerate kinase n=1 Tax=Amycolatopsis sp. TaxID=37632 RepID=UPI002B473AD1|nr:glycerate kinase [Amycolatopsis sp.]HKS48616.1 glycerate kinase [Amycolatopsis sp.]
MPRVVIAPDKFKGSLPADEVAEAIAAGLRRVAPAIEVLECPIADGGDGTVAAAVAAGFAHVPAVATGPTGERVETGYARRGDTAVVELAAVSGLSRLPAGKLAPLTASTLGVGELIGKALDDGCSHVVLGLGGSASTDGGAGLVRGLGARLLDAEGNELPPGGAALLDLRRLDVTGLRKADTVVASDVDNPLLGEHGAAAVYGPQKGATAADVELLDHALRHFADVVRAELGVDLAGAPGAGAAGGAGFAALAILGATFRPGIDVVLELTGFEDKLAGADLVITGEGSFDEQTLRGKGPAGIASAAKARGIPVVAVAGRVTLSQEVLTHQGFSAAYALTDIEPDLSRCLARPAELLEQLAAKVASEHL